jgi:hypothetical protein
LECLRRALEERISCALCRNVKNGLEVDSFGSNIESGKKFGHAR